MCEKHDGFDYYELLIEKAEKNANVNPDICIEACKSLLEGISKHIQKSFNPQLSEKDFKDRNVTLQSIFGNALNKLAEYSEDFELNLMQQLASAVKVIGEIRNSRGDISHGKLIPKAGYSDKPLAFFICQFTEAVVMYMLNVFDTIDLSYQAETKYEDCQKYNDFLDEAHPIDGIVSYSKALYAQEYDTYIDGLNDYEDEVEKDRESESQHV